MHNNVRLIQVKTASGAHCGWIPEGKIEGYLRRHENMRAGVTMIRNPERREPANAEAARLGTGEFA